MMHLRDSLFLAGSFILVFLWMEYGSPELTVPLLGLLIFLYLVSNVANKLTANHTRENPVPHESFHASILVITSLLLIGSTGNLSSPFFFLVYFLPFVVSFLLSPLSSLIFAAFAALFFFPSLVQTDYLRGMIQVGSMIALSPLAYWFGAEYRHHLFHKRQNEKIAAKVTKDVGKIITEENKTLTHTESKALTDILEQVESLQKTK